MRVSGENKRGKCYPSPLTKEKKKKEQDEKDHYTRKKCRESNPSPSICKHCSMADKCAITGSQEWLSSKCESDSPDEMRTNPPEPR